ncbi:MAG TPA: hypothetical protein VMW42_00040 [Desulfatiglandales bacterium]|nr:hypothetical protein [Desulfatiglandales bacterium]
MGTKEKIGSIAKRAARILPGIGSYQDKESIRESDKKLRDHIGAQLTDLMDRIERSKERVLSDKSLSSIKYLDDISRQIDKLSRSIRFASRGYAGVFDSCQSDEKGLSELFEFDKSLKKEIGSLEPLISKVCEKDKKPDSMILEELRDYLFRIEKRISEREILLKGLKAFND